MTEAEWKKSRYAGEMLFHLGRKTGKRKRRLFACACVRRAWHLLGDPRSRRAVEVAELFADGLADGRQLAAAHAEADGAGMELNGKCTNEQTRESVMAWKVWKAALAAKHAAAEKRPDDGAMQHAADANFDRRSNLDRENTAQANLVRDLFGNPFRPVEFDPAWRTTAAVALARAAYDEMAFDRLPVLADALEEAGCSDREVLKHCRGKGPHVRGCWVVDFVLGKS
jgi:hypothetical protein